MIRAGGGFPLDSLLIKSIGGEVLFSFIVASISIIYPVGKVNVNHRRVQNFEEAKRRFPCDVCVWESSVTGLCNKTLSLGKARDLEGHMYYVVVGNSCLNFGGGGLGSRRATGSSVIG